MSGLREEEDDEQSRQKKLEEDLEIKSLRRIVSAYLNYPEAAEEDVKRYERSFSKLPPAHKALLSHFPLKFESLRRCISTNSYFIFNMLQAFEPPFDMSQDTCCDDHDHDHEHAHAHDHDHAHAHAHDHDHAHAHAHAHDHDHAHAHAHGDQFCCRGERNVNDHLFSRESNACSGEPTSTSGRMCSLESKQISCPEGASAIDSPKASTINEEVENGVNHDPAHKNHDQHLEEEKVANNHGGHCASDCNGNECSSSHEWPDQSLQLNVPLVDVDKVRCIIRNIVRDWAAEGQKERDQCYKPILEELHSLFPDRKEESPPTCLVPGAGLGRLALEISCLGFISQGNEFSYYMMMCSSFILNQTQKVDEWTIYPWIHSNSNSLSDSDQLRPVTIPDIHPASAGIVEGFSMCGGDFVEVYSDPSHVGMWDAVVTCFFIDTAHNVIEYIEVISKILKEGGVWINLGPLLYHFADNYGQEDEMSIEPSLEDVKKIILHYGFVFEKERTVETTYTTNSRSMMQNRYHAAFWTMRKKAATEDGTD